MTNPDNVGGLPELPKEAAGYMRGCHIDLQEGDLLFTAAQMYAYGELCRTNYYRSACRRPTHHVHRGPESLPCYCAGTSDHPIGQEIAKDSAPAGGDVCATCQGHGMIGWTTGQTPEQFDQGEAPCPDCSAPAGSGEACDNCGKPLRADHAPITACACARLVLTSAYAGQGGVEAVAQKLLVGASELELRFGETSQSPVMRTAAALLRKLQQGADYVVVPREALRNEARRLRYRATETCGLDPKTTDAGAQMVHTAEALEQFASQDQEGGK